MRTIALLLLFSLPVMGTEIVVLDASKVNTPTEYTVYQFKCEYQSRTAVNKSFNGGQSQFWQNSSQVFSVNSYEPIAQVLGLACRSCLDKAPRNCKLESLLYGPATCQVNQFEFYDSIKKKWLKYSADFVATFENIDLSCPIADRKLGRLRDDAKVILLTPEAFAEKLAEEAKAKQGEKSVLKKPEQQQVQELPAPEEEKKPEVVEAPKIPTAPAVPIPRPGAQKPEDIAPGIPNFPGPPFGPPSFPYFQPNPGERSSGYSQSWSGRYERVIPAYPQRQR